jgi:hypothetical protein
MNWPELRFPAFVRSSTRFYDTVSPLCLIQRPPKNLSADQTFAATVIASNVAHFARDSKNSEYFWLKSRLRKLPIRNSASSSRHLIRRLPRNCFTKTPLPAPNHVLQRSNEKLSLADVWIRVLLFQHSHGIAVKKQYSKPPFIQNGGFLHGTNRSGQYP